MTTGFTYDENDPGLPACVRIVEFDGRFWGGGIQSGWTVRVRGRTYRATTKPLVINEAAQDLRMRIAMGPETLTRKAVADA